MMLPGNRTFIGQIIVYITCVLLMAIGRFATIPFLAFYIHDHLTRDPFIIGFALGVNGLFGIIGGVLSGIYSDKYSPKQLMVLMGAVLSFVFTIYYLGGLSFLVSLFIGNAFIGAGHSAFETASKTYVMTSFPVTQKRLVFSLRYTAINIGTVLGPLLGVWFATHNPRDAFLLVGIIYLLSVGLLGIFLNKAVIGAGRVFRLSQAWQLLISSRSIVYITLGSILFAILFSQIATNIPQILQAHKTNYKVIMGLILTTNAIIVITLSIPLGFLLSKLSASFHIKIAYTSCLLLACAYGVVAFSLDTSFLIAFVILFSVGKILFILTEAHLIDVAAPAANKGLFFGINSISRAGIFIGPVLGGALLKYFNFHVLFVTLVLLILCSMLLYQNVNKSLQREQDSINHEDKRTET